MLLKYHKAHGASKSTFLLQKQHLNKSQKLLKWQLLKNVSVEIFPINFYFKSITFPWVHGVIFIGTYFVLLLYNFGIRPGSCVEDLIPSSPMTGWWNPLTFGRQFVSNIRNWDSESLLSLSSSFELRFRQLLVGIFYLVSGKERPQIYRERTLKSHQGTSGNDGLHNPKERDTKV